MSTIDKNVKQEILEKCKNNPELKKSMAEEYNLTVITINRWLQAAEDDKKYMLNVLEDIKLSDEKIHSIIISVKKQVINIQKNPDNDSGDGVYLKDEATTKIHDLYLYLGMRLVYDIEKI